MKTITLKIPPAPKGPIFEEELEEWKNLCKNSVEVIDLAKFEKDVLIVLELADDQRYIEIKRKPQEQNSPYRRSSIRSVYVYIEFWEAVRKNIRNRSYFNSTNHKNLRYSDRLHFRWFGKPQKKLQGLKKQELIADVCDIAFPNPGYLINRVTLYAASKKAIDKPDSEVELIAEITYIDRSFRGAPVTYKNVLINMKDRTFRIIKKGVPQDPLEVANVDQVFAAIKDQLTKKTTA